MDKRFPFTQCGVTLFELMLVLVLAMAVSLCGFRGYVRIKTQHQLIQAKRVVAKVMQAAAMYANAHCHEPLAAVSADELINAGLLKATDLSNPLLSSFDIQYSEKPLRMMVMATFSNRVTAQKQAQLARALNAHLEKTGELLWQTVPQTTLSSEKLGSLKANLLSFAKRNETKDRQHNRCLNLYET